MSRPVGAARPGREAAFAALFFLAATVLLTWPQAAHLGDALTDVGDAKLNARILEWDYHQTLGDPASLYQLNFFHPARYVLAFSENLWGVSLFGFPLLAAGASPLLNYNVLLLAGMFLSALAAWALARELTGDPIASVVSGLVFAFVPWRFSQLAHFQFQWAAFLALSLLFLLRYLDRGRRRDAVLFGAAFAWNALCNVHYALFGGMLVALTLGVSVLQGRGDARRWRGTLVAAAVGGLIFLPFAIPYRIVNQVYGLKRYLGEVYVFSGRWTDFLSAGDRNKLYGPLTTRWRGAEGDFFPGLAAVLLAAVAVVRLRRPSRRAAVPAEPSPARQAWARALDAAIAVLAIVLLAALARPGSRLGPVGIGDPGRVQVWLTALVLVRLVLAFPRRSRFADLGDWLRRGPLPDNLGLLLAVGVMGLLVAAGARTPYYRFLFQSFGQVFRSIRAPARGIVLVHLALAVLAAWGLASLLRGKSARRRIAWTAAAVAILVVEYRAFPLELEPTEAEAPPVYRWLASADLPCAVVEWPLGLIYDFDYVFRQAQHGKDLVNGYSGFFPTAYRELEAELKLRPIPDSVWPRMSALGAGLLVYHAHEGRGFRASGFADALDRFLAAGGIELVRRFPHGDGDDFVFIAAETPWRDRVTAGAGDPAATRRLYEQAAARLRRDEARLAPPFGALDMPQEGQQVAAGAWAYGWALDDSGIAEVRVETELGPAGRAMYHLRHPGLGGGFPDYADSENGGFGFSVPSVPPGVHRLTLTFVGNDGGTTQISRSIRVTRPPPATPAPGKTAP